jgi:hypothetical protein
LYFGRRGPAELHLRRHLAPRGPRRPPPVRRRWHAGCVIGPEESARIRATGGTIAQININEPRGTEVVETTPHTHTTAPADTSNAVASGINFLTLLFVLAVAVVVLYFLFQFFAPLAR